MESEIDVGMSFALAGVELRIVLLATEDSVEAQRDHLLEESNRYEFEIEQLNKLIKKKDATMKAIYICVIQISRRKQLQSKQGKCFWQNQMQNNFIQQNEKWYLLFAFRVEKSMVLYCYKEVSVLYSSTSELPRSWGRRGEYIKGLRASCED